MERLYDKRFFAHLQYQQTRYKEMRSYIRDSFIGGCFDKAILAYDVMQTYVLNNREGGCVPTTIAFTHGLKNVFHRLQNKKEDLERIYPGIAKEFGQTAAYYQFGWGRELTPIRLADTIKDVSAGWFVIITNDGDHMLGLRKNSRYSDLYVWDTGPDELLIKKTNNFSFMHALDPKELYAKLVRNVNGYKSIKIVTFK